MNKNISTYITSIIVFLVLAGLAVVGFFAALFIIPIILVLGAFFIYRTRKKMNTMYMDENSNFIYVQTISTNKNDTKQNESQQAEAKQSDVYELTEKDYKIKDE